MKKYKIFFSKTGAETSSWGQETLEAKDNEAAIMAAKQRVATLQDEVNVKIDNPFWHLRFVLVKVEEIIQEEIVKPVFSSE